MTIKFEKPTLNKRPVYIMKKISAIFFVMLSFSSAFGQSEAEAWTLKECIDYALKNNIQVKQSELDMAQSNVNFNRSKADLLPTLNAIGNLRFNVGRTINPFNNELVETPVVSNNYGVNTNVMLFNGFSKLNAIKQAQAEKEASWLDYEVAKNNVSMNIVSVYTQILFNEEILSNAQKRLEVTDLQLQRTEKLVNAGVQPQATLLELKAQKASDELALVNAENQLDISRLNLKQLLQFPMDKNMEIVVPKLEVDQMLYAETADEVFEHAVQYQPSIKSAQKKLQSSEYSLAITKADRMPRLSAFAGVNSFYSSLAPLTIPRIGSPTSMVYEPSGVVLDPDGNPTNQIVGVSRPVAEEMVENNYRNQLDYNFNWSIGLSLNIPIFNGWQVKSAVASNKIAQERARYMQTDAKNRLRQDIEQAYTDVKAAAKRYNSTLNSVTSLKEVFRSNQQRFDAGVINAVDYNLSKNNLDIAESELIQAKYDYIFKVKVLDFYLGKPLTF